METFNNTNNCIQKNNDILKENIKVKKSKCFNLNSVHIDYWKSLTKNFI